MALAHVCFLRSACAQICKTEMSAALHSSETPVGVTICTQPSEAFFFVGCFINLKLGIASRPDRVSQLFELLDENGDGSVTFDEFRPVYASLVMPHDGMSVVRQGGPGSLPFAL